MNISFNLKDEFVQPLIAAAKWKLNRTDLTDNRTVAKCLKQYISQLIYEHNRSTVIGAKQTELNQVSENIHHLNDMMRQKQEEYEILNRDYEITNLIPPVDDE